ncbi:MAG: replicative DNA helicase, partial [Pseudomonadota bacterium]
GLIEMSEGIRSRALGPRGDMSADQQVEEAEKMLFELARSGRPGKGHKSFKDSILEMLETAATAYKREGGLAGYSTGISDLDKHLGGLQRSDLVIVAGRPGMGKTAMATTLAYNIAKAHLNCQKTDKNGRKIDGAKVLYFSLEMSSEQLATRIISSVTGISSSRIRRGEIDQEEFSSLAQAAKEVEKTPLFIDDTGGISIAALAARARRLTLKEDIGVIMVDYLQLVTPSGTKRGDNRVQEISEITQTLKALAKELDVPIIALSQLSRAVESREDKRPMLSDLRESGSIEQDADIVMFLYRASYYLEQQKPPQGDEDAMRDWQEKRARLGYESEVIIGKHRHGPVGKADLYFDPKYTRFTNLQKADINGPVGEYGPH